MHTRPTPLEDPDRAPYARVAVPDREDHLVKIPSVARALRLARDLDPSTLSTFVGLAEGMRPTSNAALFGLASGAGPSGAYAIAALIGVAWYHETQALDSERGELSLQDYGEAVYEELHEAGYSLDQILALGMTIGVAIWDQSQIRAEVREKALFFLRRRAGKTSPPSTPGSDTSETPTA